MPPRTQKKHNAPAIHQNNLGLSFRLGPRQSPNSAKRLVNAASEGPVYHDFLSFYNFCLRFVNLFLFGHEIQDFFKVGAVLFFYFNNLGAFLFVILKDFGPG